jgi:hypothetical protein
LNYEKSQSTLLKSITSVKTVVEAEVTYEVLDYVEFVLEKKQIKVNYQVLENQVGNHNSGKFSI